MTTSVETFRNEFTEGVMDVTWRQWCRVGVAGSVSQKDRWIVDPEVLLAFTTEVGRHDARMFDEVMDWLAMNGRWINTQRLATIVRQDNVADKAVMGAVASWMTERDKSAKWRGLAHRAESDTKTPPEPLFRTATKKTIRSTEHVDAHFRSYGLIRPPVHTRGMTQSVNMKDSANILFKSRAVFGIGMRADVIAYMMANEYAHPRSIARILGYNHMRVQEMLVALAKAGIAFVRPVGRVKQYWLDRGKWRRVLMGEESFEPQWVNWRALTRGLIAIWRQVWMIEEGRADEYIFSSKMRSAMQSARSDLMGSEMGLAIENDKGYAAETYLPVFMRDVRNIFGVLSGQGR